MARGTRSAAPAAPKSKAPSTAQIVEALRYLARETKREAEVEVLLGGSAAEEPADS